MILIVVFCKKKHKKIFLIAKRNKVNRRELFFCVRDIVSVLIQNENVNECRIS